MTQRWLSRRELIGSAAVLAAASPARGADTVLADLVASFDSERRRRNVPSISVALLEAGDVQLHARGVRDAVSSERVTTTTIYQAASISKTFAGLLACRLHAAGTIDLDADVSQYLKRWSLPAAPLWSDKPVTLRRLYGMTAGLNVPGFAGYRPGAPLPDIVQILNGAPPANSTAISFIAPPGTFEHYSGGGCEVGALAMIDRTGIGYADLVERLVISPLGMHQSGFWQPPPHLLQARFALAHDDDGVPVEGGWNVYPELAAAGLWSTPADLIKLPLALTKAAAGEPTIFCESGLRELFKSVDELGYGLGIARAADGRVGVKRGNNLGFRSMLVTSPWTGQGAVVMTNGNQGQEIVDAMLDALAHRYRWPTRSPWPE